MKELSELFDLYDKEIDQNIAFQRRFEDKLEDKGLAYHEKWIKPIGFENLSVGVLFALILLVIQLLAAYLDGGLKGLDVVFLDFSYFISIVNGVGLFLILEGGTKLRKFVANLIQLSKDSVDNSSEKFFDIFTAGYTKRKLVIISIAFGILNPLLGLLFGIPYIEEGNWFLLASLLFQFITSGLIGGIAVAGLFVVIKLINAISIKEEIELRLFYPDKCAGTLIIGNILFYFSLYFIIIGICIFLFIHTFSWTNGNTVVRSILVIWELFPFILGILIFFIPLKKLNSILNEYKIQEQWRIRKRMTYIANLMMNLDSDRTETDAKLTIYNNQYEKLKAIDLLIQEMNTWPYNLRYRTLFLGILFPTVIAIVAELSTEWMKTIIGN